MPNPCEVAYASVHSVTSPVLPVTNCAFTCFSVDAVSSLVSMVTMCLASLVGMVKVTFFWVSCMGTVLFLVVGYLVIAYQQHGL